MPVSDYACPLAFAAGQDGVLPTKSAPDQVLTYPSDPGLQGLVWNLTDPKFGFEITSTVFYSPVTPGKKSKHAFMFHHGHSNCVCPKAKGDPVIKGAKCRCGGRPRGWPAAQLPCCFPGFWVACPTDESDFLTTL
jgi:hypothetical protein